MVIKFQYAKKCCVCGCTFFTTRNHAKTCSTRCRLTLYKINQNIQDFKNKTHIEVIQLNDKIIEHTHDFVSKGDLKNTNGYQMEFINGFKDSSNNLKICIFRCDELRYIEVWNEYNSDVLSFFYNY